MRLNFSYSLTYWFIIMVELSSANQQVVLMGLRGKQKHTFILISFEIIFPQLPYEVTVEDLNLNNSK